MDANLAKLCYFAKQHFARTVPDTERMDRKPINDVLAENLAYFMEAKELTQIDLSRRSGVAQTTISLYLAPNRRNPGKSGKPPSAKLAEVDALATALEVEVWQLLRQLTPMQWLAYQKIEEAFRAMNPDVVPVPEPRARPKPAA